MEQPIQTKITKVKDAQLSLVGKEKDLPRLSLKVELSNSTSAKINVFLGSYTAEEIQNLLKSLRYTGVAEEDFSKDSDSARAANFGITFDSAVDCTVSEKEFVNDEGEHVTWYLVEEIPNVYRNKSGTFNKITKEQYVSHFSSKLGGSPAQGSDPF